MNSRGRRLRVALVGAGLVGQAEHAHFLWEERERFELVAVVDASPTVRAGDRGALLGGAAPGGARRARRRRSRRHRLRRARTGSTATSWCRASSRPARAVREAARPLGRGVRRHRRRPRSRRARRPGRLHEAPRSGLPAPARAAAGARRRRAADLGRGERPRPAALRPPPADGDRTRRRAGARSPTPAPARLRAAPRPWARRPAPQQRQAFEGYLSSMVHDVSLVHGLLEQLGVAVPAAAGRRRLVGRRPRRLASAWSLPDDARATLTHHNLPGVNDYRERAHGLLPRPHPRARRSPLRTCATSRRS